MSELGPSWPSCLYFTAKFECGLNFKKAVARQVLSRHGANYFERGYCKLTISVLIHSSWFIKAYKKGKVLQYCMNVSKLHIFVLT